MSSLEPGPRDHLVTRLIAKALADLDPEVVSEVALDPAEAPERLARHATEVVRRSLAELVDVSSDEQAAQLNEVLERLKDEDGEVAVPARVLRGIQGRSDLGHVIPLPPLPSVPFSQSDLLVNAEGQPNVGSELKAELASADSVDLICAFVIWSGVRHLRDELAALADRGARIRVITTTYMGATEKKAVDELVKLGAEVKVALDARTTKLHAKAWLLERESGLTTAFVGSSNLSHTALFDGLEWNVRLSALDAMHVIERVRITFDAHWESEHFERYDPSVNGEELEDALAQQGRRSLTSGPNVSFANLDVRAYPHQQRMLEALRVERERHDRHRNLVVAATGTGKTVVAALDFRQLTEQHSDLSLLFVAHRQQILEQSLATYRAVLRDGSFGEIHAGGSKASGRHVFAMIQSLKSPGEIKADAYDVVVVDEFHHAAAKTYDRLLKRLQPKELLGLTATPERLDGEDVTEWFNQRIAVELRLWEAIDQGFLVPFQYFGVADGTDLTQVTWRRGGYRLDELSNLFSNDDVRVAKLLSAMEKIVYDLGAMRALGFCVSKEHAHFMAQRFSDAGLESVAITGDDPQPHRAAVLKRLQSGEIRCVFSVEVLGEGVDVPNVDTVLLLRPTASPTVFAQQLGRGLRRADKKSHLTVIDMIGQHRREFRFEDRLRAILDTRRGPVIDQVKSEFPFLPAGCTIDLDRQSRDLVLENLRSAVLRSRWAALLEDMKGEKEGVSIADFLERNSHRLADVYRSGHSWTELKRAAGQEVVEPRSPDLEADLLRSLGRLTHIDDPERVSFYVKVLRGKNPPKISDANQRAQKLLTMLAWGLGSSKAWSSLDDFYRDLWLEPAVKAELAELLGYLDGRSTTLAAPSGLPAEVPLTVHARYSRQEIVAALGSGSGVKPKVTQGGILWVEEAKADVFFIDLHKAERDYSPSTMYRDYAISPELFHWESQSRQTPEQPTVQRYINHVEMGTRVLLFVRDRKRFELGTTPFTFLGEARYVSHKGERPVSFTWRLPTPMPAELFETARSVAVA